MHIYHDTKTQLQFYIEECHNRVGIHSNLSKWKEDKYYILALAMGVEIIPTLLKEMETTPSWVHILLLNDLVAEKPIVAPENYGKFKKIVETWLHWGKERKYI